MASTALKLALAGVGSLALGPLAMALSPPGPCTPGAGIFVAFPAMLMAVLFILGATIVAVGDAFKRARHQRMLDERRRTTRFVDPAAFGPYRQQPPVVLEEPEQTTPDPRPTLIICCMAFGGTGLLFREAGAPLIAIALITVASALAIVAWVRA